MDLVIAGRPAGASVPVSHAAPASDVGREIESFIASAPNNGLLKKRLDAIDSPAKLALFVHRFLHFNDALAARVPFLAGWIHLDPDLFSDPNDTEEFCRQRNACIAAHIAEAANDEYCTTPGRNMVHQSLSQNFFRGILDFYAMNGSEFDLVHKLPENVKALLQEARNRFFGERTAANVYAAIGFHVGLEFFANEEFNIVDGFLCEHFADLTTALRRGEDQDDAPYLWLSLHTVVEVAHYRAGLEAVADSLRYCRPPKSAPVYARHIMTGLAAFADLQRRFYQAVLDDAGHA